MFATLPQPAVNTNDLPPFDLEGLRARRPVLWAAPVGGCVDAELSTPAPSISATDVEATVARWTRFAPLLARLFPELAPVQGRIESELAPAPRLQAALAAEGTDLAGGALYVKADHGLPVAGSIKARGGVHEVLEHAEALAQRHGLLPHGADYRVLATPAARALFAEHEVAVGSTGNLGLSIGVMASTLGLRATVHMSADAKAWKKARLRSRGVHVVEHAGDYAEAVAAGRRAAEADARCHFVDDERSRSLFLGYAAAAPHLAQQLAQAGRPVDAEHPLFVYLPCGVGGAPGGIAWGLRQVLGPHVHCFFAEPVASPCFLLAMMAMGPEAGRLPAWQGALPSVYDLGLDNRTEADGLAVPCASELATAAVAPFLGGVYTVGDERLFELLHLAEQTEGLRIEPSAAAGFDGPALLLGSDAGRAWLASRGIRARQLAHATHIAWTTGGRFVPDEEYQRFHARGAALRGLA